MASKKTRAFRAWKKRMGYTQREVSVVLDLSVSGVRYYEAGDRRDRKGEESKNVEIPLVVLFACAAVEAGLKPVGV